MSEANVKEFIPRILWFALLVSQGIYLAIMALIDFGGEPAETDQLLLSLGVVSFVTAAAIPVARQFLFYKRLGEMGREEVYGKFLTTLIVSLGLAESIAVNGLVVGFLSQDITWQLPFAGVAAAITIALFPSYKKAEMAWQRKH